MAAVSKITVTNVFADDTTSKVTIDGIKPENLTSGQIAAMKEQVEQFNTQTTKSSTCTFVGKMHGRKRSLIWKIN